MGSKTDGDQQNLGREQWGKKHREVGHWREWMLQAMRQGGEGGKDGEGGTIDRRLTDPS